MMKPSNPTDGTSRRSFLSRLWVFLGLAALAEGAWIALSFLKPRKANGEIKDSRIIVAGPVDQFEPGSVNAFPQGRFYLARLEDGGFLALSRTCTHLGCTVPWDSQQNRFVCPCHASAFTITGEVLNPPAPRPLDLFEVRIENRIVKVNTRNITARTSFIPSQVTRS